MRGPIDYIIVGFDGAEFNGKILDTVADAIDKGIIGLVALSVVKKDDNGNVQRLGITAVGNSYLLEFVNKYPTSSDLISEDDIDEVGELLENNTAAGFLVIEQLWAKPLKKSLLEANGYLIAEGRIHPEAALELESSEEV